MFEVVCLALVLMKVIVLSNLAVTNSEADPDRTN